MTRSSNIQRPMEPYQEQEPARPLRASRRPYFRTSALAFLAGLVLLAVESRSAFPAPNEERLTTISPVVGQAGFARAVPHPGKGDEVRVRYGLGDPAHIALADRRITALAFSPGGEYVAAGDEVGNVHFLFRKSANSQRLETAFLVEHPRWKRNGLAQGGAVTSLALQEVTPVAGANPRPGNTGPLFTLSAAFANGQIGRAVVQCPPPPQEATNLTPSWELTPLEGAQRLCPLPDGDEIVLDTAGKVWRVGPTRRVLFSIGNAQATGLAALPNGSLVVVSTKELTTGGDGVRRGVLLVWSQGGDVRRLSTGPLLEPRPVSSVQFPRDGAQLLYFADRLSSLPVADLAPPVVARTPPPAPMTTQKPEDAARQELESLRLALAELAADAETAAANAVDLKSQTVTRYGALKPQGASIHTEAAAAREASRKAERLSAEDQPAAAREAAAGAVSHRDAAETAWMRVSQALEASSRDLAALAQSEKEATEYAERAARLVAQTEKAAKTVGDSALPEEIRTSTDSVRTAAGQVTTALTMAQAAAEAVSAVEATIRADLDTARRAASEALAVAERAEAAAKQRQAVRLNESPVSLLGSAPVAKVNALALGGSASSPELFGGRELRFYRWTSVTGAPERQGPLGQLSGPAKGEVYALAVTPDGTVFSAGTDGALRRWTRRTAGATGPAAYEASGTREFGGEIYSLVYIPSPSPLLVAGGIDKRVHVLPLDSQSALPKGESSVPVSDTVFSIAAEQQGERIGVGCLDGSVHVLRVRGTVVTERIFRAGSPTGSQVICVCFLAPDLLAWGATDGWIRVGNVRTGLVTDLVKAHDKTVTALVFEPATGTLITAGLDDNVRISHLKVAGTGGDAKVRLLSEHTVTAAHCRGVRSLVLLPGGTHVVSGGVDGSVWLWSVQGR